MIKRIYNGMLEDLENIRDAFLSAETRIFHGDEKQMGETLSKLSRELIDFKQTARVHREMWEEMIEGTEGSILGKDFMPYVHDMRDEFNKIHELIGNCRELLADLRETNSSLLTTKQNEVMKILTLVAFIFYPLTFVTSLFAIPSQYVPFINSPQGWNVLVVFLILISGAMIWYFKHKKWI
jgi:magnesium transporter